jgi:hypothetical protein
MGPRRPASDGVGDREHLRDFDVRRGHEALRHRVGRRDLESIRSILMSMLLSLFSAEKIAVFPEKKYFSIKLL